MLCMRQWCCPDLMPQSGGFVRSEQCRDVLFQHSGLSAERGTSLYHMQPSVTSSLCCVDCLAIISCRQTATDQGCQHQHPVSSVACFGHDSVSGAWQAEGSWLGRVVAAWQAGRVSNLDYLLYLNLAAGRSFNDLTQWHVDPPSTDCTAHAG